MDRVSELEMARRHVLEGSQRVREQRARIEDLHCKGLPDGQAIELLSTFQMTLTLMRQHLEIIQAEIQSDPRLR